MKKYGNAKKTPGERPRCKSTENSKNSKDAWITGPKTIKKLERLKAGRGEPSLMMTAQRREELKKYMLEHKSASVLDMAQRFQVSGQTIRRDFEALEKEGFLLRSYGGAMVKDRKADFVPNTVKSELFVDEKKTICRRAAAQIYPNDCIFIDHSTTALALCDEIRQMPLTVVTNSFRVIDQLSDCVNIQLVCTGGTYQSGIEGFSGLETVRYLQQHCVDKAFLSCRAIDPQRGVNDTGDTTANVRQTVIENADCVYLLADHTKFGKSGFITVCGIDRLDFVITDQPLDREWKKLFSENGVTVLDGSHE